MRKRETRTKIDYIFTVLQDRDSKAESDKLKTLRPRFTFINGVFIDLKERKRERKRQTD